MTSGFGVDASEDGLSGTTSQDIRRMLGGLYTEGVIQGCVVTTSASEMTYTVSSGLVSIMVSPGEVILVPVPARTVNAPPAPISGSRADILYVQQRYPSIEGDAEVFIGVDQVLPPRSLTLQRFTVNAGTTVTNGTTRFGDRSYSIPYGAKLNRLHGYQLTTMGLAGTLPNALTRFGHGSFYLPTDRRVKFKLQAVISANLANGFDNSRYCEYGFLPNVDGGDFVLWATPGLHQAWQTVSFEASIDLLAGTHTCSIGLLRLTGPGEALGHYGTDASGYGRRGVEFTVEDDGPII